VKLRLGVEAGVAFRMAEKKGSRLDFPARWKSAAGTDCVTWQGGNRRHDATSKRENSYALQFRNEKKRDSSHLQLKDDAWLEKEELTQGAGGSTERKPT